ncbi:Chemotaxis protein methyltransferase CheR [Candidatus Rhodobacter oscarellae]|uniref:protein-glutamate O-methyltransferase n=1 Tax=Candidatus Rhodobacter oscarellae TaxID=1675527 RepID=A0A0J9EC02_9RHOB|nr:CheR family methyltransferase [Candidatus Rhodobacter lobularis]KMW60302.1 Chemotaxis protein methyltransferase CheR [Candidatus Rhodobacter lobularis]
MSSPAESKEEKPLFYVGIAASAGGLEAATLLAQNLPGSASSVYILAQHMSPTHNSLLTSIISRETSLPVLDITDGMEPKANTIYVTPPNHDVVLKDGKLRLMAPSGHASSPKPSADRLFDSLAKNVGAKCLAIVLSGTGSDGSYGVQSVREAGGITIAQEPSSAKYDGMPASAIETGFVDLTLTPEQIGRHLNRILTRPDDLQDLQQLNRRTVRLTDLMHILLARTQVDFRDYKENTVNRRIARRMVALGIDEYDDYVDYCRRSETEVDALFRDLLISVTRFFRDPMHFDQFARVIEELVRDHSSGQLRVWVIGCATGEEAYSLAILFAEALGGLDALSSMGLQVFATDIDSRALEVARKGVYPISAASDIPSNLTEKYFEVDGANLRVKPALRKLILFSYHNVAQDPPFKNVDLVSLRNILIYFNARLQERVLRRVHSALLPSGRLFLGTSETVGATHAYFEARVGLDKVFSRRDVRTKYEEPNFNLSRSRRQAWERSNADKQEGARGQMFETLARTVAPNGFITTRNGEIVRVFGNISNIVEVSEHSALNMDTKILLKGLRDEASSLISVSLKMNETRSGRWHDMGEPGDKQVRIRAFPIQNEDGGEDHVLFAVESREGKAALPKVTELSAAERAKYVLEMEREMVATREALEQTVEELQTSNEELQSVNEELQSANEELQATNEELETSNEELESTNEELITVNEEMHVGTYELETVTSELTAVLDHVPYPILVVDPALLIRRLSEPALAFFGIDELPVTGMHLAQTQPHPDFPELAKLCSEAFRLRKAMSIEVHVDGQHYWLGIHPFSDSAGQASGMNVTVVPQRNGEDLLSP